MQILQSFYKEGDQIGNEYYRYDNNYPVNAGNLQIFILNLSLGLAVDFYTSLEIAIIRDYDDIFNYIVDNFYYPTDKNDISLLLNEASKKKSPKYFNYIENKYNLNELMTTFQFTEKEFFDFLCNSCKFNNAEVSVKLIDFIFANYSQTNFTQPLIIAFKAKSKEICQYLVDKKVILSISKLLKKLGYCYL